MYDINCLLQGNFENQQVLFNHQIIDTINRILQMSYLQDEEFETIHVGIHMEKCLPNLMCLNTHLKISYS